MIPARHRVRAKLARPVEIFMAERAKLAREDLVIARHAQPAAALGHRDQFSDVHELFDVHRLSEVHQPSQECGRLLESEIRSRDGSAP
jgi:hypothetical protein